MLTLSEKILYESFVKVKKHQNKSSRSPPHTEVLDGLSALIEKYSSFTNIREDIQGNQGKKEKFKRFKLLASLLRQNIECIEDLSYFLLDDVLEGLRQKLLEEKQNNISKGFITQNIRTIMSELEFRYTHANSGFLYKGAVFYVPVNGKDYGVIHCKLHSAL